MKKICGVYQIVNIITGKVYVGSSVDIKSRWQEHTRDLKLNRHENQKLQIDWNKYTRSAFKFKILKISSEDQLSKIEQNYLNSVKNNSYNMENKVVRCPSSKLKLVYLRKKNVRTTDVVNYYVNGHTKCECRKQFDIGDDLVTRILKDYNVLRSKPEALKLMHQLKPEIAKKQGAKRVGLFLGAKSYWFGKPGPMSGKKMPEKSIERGLRTRTKRYGDNYHPKEALIKIRNLALTQPHDSITGQFICK